MSVRNALLGLLQQRPRHGYELREAFTALVGGEQNWPVKPAQIYTTLSRLEAGGLIIEEGLEQDGGPEKHIFAITPAGRLELNEWLVSPAVSQHQRDEFFLKLMLCLVTGAASPRELIYAQRARLYQELHGLTRQRSEGDPRRELAYILLLEQAIMHLEADLRWLDMVEARLDEIKRQPLPEPELRPRGRPRKLRAEPGEGSPVKRTSDVIASS
jgi:DNA-binding PadR family transcriptional regulator